MFLRTRHVPFEIARTPEGHPSVKLDGMEISHLIASDGLTVEFSTLGGGLVAPEVTVRFAPGALDLDLAVDLLVEAQRRAEEERA